MSPPISYRPFERVRDDWTAALRVLLKRATDAEIDAFAAITNEMMDALVNRAMAGTVAAAKVVESDALHQEIKDRLTRIEAVIDLISQAVVGADRG